MYKAVAIPREDMHGKYSREKYATYCGDVYLHGALEERNGYDMVLLKEKPDTDGIYDCAVFMGDNGACKAKLYFWTSGNRNRGYVVLDLKNDVAYAEKAFAVRSHYC